MSTPCSRRSVKNLSIDVCSVQDLKSDCISGYTYCSSVYFKMTFFADYGQKNIMIKKYNLIFEKALSENN